MITTRGHAGRPRPTGERPREGFTPGSLLALHDAGYRAVLERLAGGRVLDVGCGEGFETLRLAAPGRWVLGVDDDEAATEAAMGAVRETTRGSRDLDPGAGLGAGLGAARMDALTLGIVGGAFDAVCSSHLIEHFANPESHAAELARVLAPGGTAFILTPNAPADFENPFHLHLFGPGDLGELLGRYFDDVWVGGLDASATVKADFAARRATAQRILRLDVFDLRHRIPRRWYVALYTSLLPLAYRLLGARGRDGTRPDTASAWADEWFVTGEGLPGTDGEPAGVVDDTTPVLFAICRKPRHPGRSSESP